MNQPVTSTSFGETSARPHRAPGLGRFGTTVGIAVVALVIAGLVWSATSGSATSASRPRIFGNSLVLDDDSPLPVIGMATAQVTVQLAGVYQQVDARAYGDVQAVPVSDGTFLVNRTTGTFNLLGTDNYVVDPSGSGVSLPPVAGLQGAEGYADGASAYIVRYAPATSIALVDQTTVAEAAAVGGSAGKGGAPTAVAPAGLITLPGPVPRRPGAVLVDGGDLWAIVTGSAGTCSLVEVQPTGTNGRRLSGRTVEAKIPCAGSALASAGSTVALAEPSAVQLLTGKAPRRVAVAALDGAVTAIPVSGTSSVLWWMVEDRDGWSDVGVDRRGGLVDAHHLDGIPPDADPAPPVMSAGAIFTIDLNGYGQPDLWVIDAARGAVGTVASVPRYPAKNTREQASFAAAEVLVDGPRVVFNNPGSVLAVVVFTDNSHGPVIVNKRSAVDVSATGPANVNTAAHHRRGAGGGRHHATPPGTSPTAPPTTAAGPTINDQVTCANTDQKPYQPQVAPVSPASQSALVTWTYRLIDEQDCEPDSWIVTVSALGGAAQPDRRHFDVSGQEQAEVNGLRPDTTYDVVVTAIINDQTTTSLPVTFRTNGEGPEPPSSVRATVLADGDWLVRWTPCRGAGCYVPAEQWDLVATACGGSFVGASLPSEQLPARQDSAVIDATSDDLLGTSLDFTVQGQLSSGLRGDPGPASGCVESWRAPEARAIQVSASAVPSGAGTVNGTVDLSPTPGGESNAPVYGSQQSTVTYTVVDQTTGAVAATRSGVNLGSATFDALQAGNKYAATVVIAPVGHPSASVTKQTRRFSNVVAWPDITPSVSSVSVAPGGVKGLVALQFPSTLSAADQYVATSVSLTCDESSAPLTVDNQSLQGLSLTVTVPNLVVFGGTGCSVSVASLSDSTPNGPYGSGQSNPSASVDFGFPAAPRYGFSASFDDYTTCDVVLNCPLVSVLADQSGDAGGNWRVVVTGATTSISLGQCTASANIEPEPGTPVQLQLPAGCTGAATVSVSWNYYGDPQTPVTLDVGGTPPTTTTSTSSTTSTTTTTLPTSTTTTAGTGTGTTGTTGSTGGSSVHLVPTTPSATPRATGPAAAAEYAPVPAGTGSQDRLPALVAIAVVALAGGAVARRRRSRRNDRLEHQ